ncbi:MAG TPA: GNAT family N-acetyltransferase [candidate division Zixibacteria bacterium]|nr:GNAT family N-acetyltransferase [candidate division Zixibacteria bacterium]
MSDSPDTGLLVRALHAEDVAELLRLWKAAELEYRPTGRDSVEQLSRQMETNPGGFIGAFDGSLMIGAILASDDTRRGWINRLAVHPDYRRRGIGQILIREAEAELRRRGLQIIAALIEDSNTPSRGVFEACGYTTMPEILYYSKREHPDV